MKILFLSSRVPFPVVDGHTNRTYNTIKELACCGNSIQLLALAQPGDERNGRAVMHLREYCDRIEIVEAPSKKISPAMVARLFAGVLLPVPYTVCRHYSFAYAKKVEAVIEKGGFDLIHFDVLPLAVYRKNMKLSVPAAITDHDVCHVKARRISEGIENPLIRWFLRYESIKLKRYERRMLSVFPMVVSVSETDGSALSALSGGSAASIVVAPNGVESGIFAVDRGGEEERTILWVGGASYFPNKEAVAYFIREILPHIRRRSGKSRFLVVGNGFEPMKMNLTEEDRDGVEFLGFVPDVSPCLARSQVFVCPLKSGSGTRLKLLEAMAAGKAIVTTSVGCEGIEGIPGTHFLVSDSPEGFAEAVVKALEDADLRRRLGERARQLVKEKYQWSGIIGQLNEAYKRLAVN